MMDAPMDDVAIEEYANWLEQLEKTDPEVYTQVMATIQRQVQTEALETEAGDLTQHGNRPLYDMRKSSVAATTTNSPVELMPRFPGDKVMGEDGLKATQEGMYIEVHPGFALKTNDIKNHKKVFVNVVFADEIQRFSRKTKLDGEGNEKEGIHVPLSLGAPRDVKESSLAFDVAVNTKVVENCQADKTGAFRNFVCELAIEYIDQKYKMNLDGRYKLLRLTYRGELPPPKHYILKTQAPIIQEVTTESLAALKKTHTSKFTTHKVPKASSIPKTATAHFVIFEERIGNRILCQRNPSVMKGSTPLSPAIMGQAGDQLIVSIEFENNVRASDVELELQAELFSVKTATHYDLEIFLPYPVDVNSPRVCFDQIRNTMDVILKIDKSWDTIGPDCGSAPWLRAQALAKENDLQSPGPARTTDCASEKSKTLMEMFQFANTQSSKNGNRLSLQAARQWEDEELPEDQFHREDVMSMHILEQRRIEHEQKAKQPEAKRDEVGGMHKKAQETRKSWQETYPSEPEETYIDVEDIVRQEKSRLDRHEQQRKEETNPDKYSMPMEDAERTAAKWSANKKYGNLDLQSALAFELL